MAVSSTTFFIRQLRHHPSSRSEKSSIVRYWTKVTDGRDHPDHPQLQGLEQASETGHRLESRAMMPPRARRTIA